MRCAVTARNWIAAGANFQESDAGRRHFWFGARRNARYAGGNYKPSNSAVVM